MKKIDTRKAIIESFVLAFILTGGSMLYSHFTSTVPINWIEVGSVFFSFACTWLCTRQVRFNYVLGVVSTALLVVTFWQAGLYGSMLLNIYLLPTVIYGWFIWGKDSKHRPVEHVKPVKLIGYLAVTFAVWLGAYLIITHYNGHMVALDGGLLVGTVLAQFMLDRKKLENWFVWIVVDVVSIYVYWTTGLTLLAIQFAFFLANAVYAWYLWNKSMHEIITTPEEEIGFIAQPAAVATVDAEVR